MSEITGKTKLLGLIGDPVAHSASPQMYNYAFQLLGLDYSYMAFRVPENAVSDAIHAMRTLHMRGMNVTMPDKRAVIPHLDVISREAELIGAVNTIVNDDGVLTGYCTDGIGFVSNLKANGVNIIGRKIAIAGAGGAATAIQIQCALSGAAEVILIKRKNKTFADALHTAEVIKKAVPACGVSVVDQNDMEQFRKAVQSAEIFVNATSVGMSPNAAASILPDKTFLHKGLVIADIVYNPIDTALLKMARENGNQAIGGKGMLLWQGVEAFRLFTGLQMPVKKVAEKYFPEE